MAPAGPRLDSNTGLAPAQLLYVATVKSQIHIRGLDHMESIANWCACRTPQLLHPAGPYMLSEGRAPTGAMVAMSEGQRALSAPVSICTRMAQHHKEHAVGETTERQLETNCLVVGDGVRCCLPRGRGSVDRGAQGAWQPPAKSTDLAR